MSKSRSYTRKELEGLRRADLQNLFKIHGLKGANQRSDHLVDGLIAFFGSSAFRPASPAQTRHADRQLRHTEGGVHRATGGAAAATRVIAPMKRRPGAPAGTGGVARPLLGTQVSELRRQDRPVLQRRDSSEVRNSQEGIVLNGSVDDGDLTPTQATMSPSAPSLSLRDTPAKSLDTLPNRLQMLSDRIDNLASREAGPSTTITRPEFETLQAEVSKLRQAVGTGKSDAASSGVELDAVKEEWDAAWQAKLDDLELKWNLRLSAATEEFGARLQALESRLARYSPNPALSRERSHADNADVDEGAIGTTGAIVSADRTSALGKRRERDQEDEVETAVSSSATLAPDASPSKRPRVVDDPANASDDKSRAPLRTPSPPSGAAYKTPDMPTLQMFQVGGDEPHTPVPAHQSLAGGASAVGNSQTPVIAGIDGLGRPPAWPGLSRAPPPMFATTPRPTEPRSPTLDMPPSASRSRIAQRHMPTMLTPGRRRPDGDKSAPMTAPRAVSQAHMELSTITESGEAGTPAAAIAAAAQAGHHGPRSRLASRGYSPPEPLSLAPDLLGPSRAKSVRPGTVSPPKLSPSPSIMETRFNPLPFPRQGESSSAGVQAPQAASAAPIALAAPAPAPAPAAAVPAHDTPPRADRSSPSRDFMDIALFGLQQPQPSPSGLATPKHRTLLGTERYMDTRFEDMPMMQWDSPVGLGDYGLGSTPRPPQRDG